MTIPDSPPNKNEIFEYLNKKDPGLLLKMIELASPFDSQGKYRHWDKLKYLELPELIDSHELWWVLLKLARRNISRELQIKGIDNINFRFSMIDRFHEQLHFIDQNAWGNIALDRPIMNTQMKHTYLVSSLIEEAISSSQLEGATTAPDVAKKMIIEERKPRDRSERMILNNYRAIQFVRSIKKESLTPNIIKDIHKIVSDQTLDDNNYAGNYRNEKDNIKIIADNQTVVFTPPPSKELEKRVLELCDFVNNDNSTTFFIHPVIKAIIIHFYFAYIHPFVDGNGRTARALFYWYMLKKGYWLTEYISISRILKGAPSKYALSFLYTETDDNDLTYFVEYQLSVIERAINDFHQYIIRKMQELADVESILKNNKLSNKLNRRQLSILRHALKSPGYTYTIHEHKNYHGIAYETARTDLLSLADNFKLLAKVKEGKSFVFIVPSDLINRINRVD